MKEDDTYKCPMCGVEPVLSKDAYYDPSFGRYWHFGCWLKHRKSMEQEVDAIFEEKDE